ncbi:hypothetical protein [Photorhabdus sp. SF281]
MQRKNRKSPYNGKLGMYGWRWLSDESDTQGKIYAGVTSEF